MKLITLDNLNHFKEKLEKLNATKEELIAIKETLKSSVFNLIYPVGVTYVQYPQQASPMELWGSFSTWEVIDYDGAFFRAAGGNANAFIEESGVLRKQADAIKTHTTGGMSANATGSFYNARSFFSEEFGGEGNVSVDKSYNGENGAYALEWGGTAGKYRSRVYINVSHTHTYSGDVETRPQNYTVKIWKRIA